jgi:two-component system KDP operon response regulator KdpE
MATPRLGLVLVVDDEPQMRRLLRVSLPAQGFEVLEAADAATALKMLARNRVDLMLLDLGLPDKSGFEVIEAVRKASAVPIIVLSVRDDESGKVKAFDLGADDYVTKPFSMAELIARLRTALRHRLQVQGAAPALRCGDIEIDLVGRVVTRDGVEIHLSKTEFDVLGLLARHSGKVLTHDYILKQVWGAHAVGDVQYLRVYVRALRHKLEPEPDRPALIRTETGIGYRLICAEPDPLPSATDGAPDS